MVFSMDYVERYVPPASGVYGLSNAREWVYVGESDNVRAALMEHLREPRSAIMEHRPAGFTYELCDLDRRYARQDRLIRELEPACNRRGPAGVTHTATRGSDRSGSRGERG
jgi:hypothetical protein